MKAISKISLLLLTGPLIALLNFSGSFDEQLFFEKTDKLYLFQLGQLKEQVTLLKTACRQKQSLSILKKHFVAARIAYKKTAILLEYFNPYETKYLNGPNLPRIESEAPNNIIEPSGFQIIEEYLYSGSTISFADLIKQSDIILKIISRIKGEPDRKYKFKKPLVFASLQASLVSITAMGITGFDSPVAFRSIQEVPASLDGFQLVLDLFKEDLQRQSLQEYGQMQTFLMECKQYLSSNKNFNNFNRLDFLTCYLNPLSSLLTTTGKKMDLLSFSKNSPTIDTAGNVFAVNVFNSNFFAPAPPYEITSNRIELGKMLFYDPILSGTKKKSCASCHKAEFAFTDGLKTALSINDSTFLQRNTPTLWNAGFQTKLFWDSRTAILENQLDEVVHNKEEMEGSLKQSVEVLKKDSTYSALFRDAYPADKTSVVEFNIANAISSYVRSLVSLNSRFDNYMRGDTSSLSLQEKDGFNLFAGKAKCATCHFIPLFNGLVPPMFTETESEVLGVPKTADKKNAKLDDDAGRFGFTTSVIHRFAFKTPTLRNIELTAPYMHNGVYKTLEEVVEFYNNGGGKGLKIAPKNQTLPFDKLSLTTKEIKDVVSFMKTLTDTSYTSYSY